MKEKEPTLFEETSVTVYEHDHGYTFFVLIIGQLWYTSFANVCQCTTYLCCKSSNCRVIHLSSDNGTVCLYDDVVLVAVFDYFRLLKEGV